MSLFRPEAVANRRLASLGTVRIATPPVLAAAAVAALAALAGLLVLAFVGHYTRKARVTGVLVPRAGVVRVFAPEPARLSARHVDEGDRVEAGALLATLAIDREGARGALGDAVGAELVRQRQGLVEQREQAVALFRLERQQLDERLRRLQVELRLLDDELSLQRARVEGAESVHARYLALVEAGFFSAAALAQRREEALERRLALATMTRNREAMNAQAAALVAERDAQPLRHADRDAALGREIAALDERRHANDARRELVLRAPRPGVVATLQAQPGQLLSPAVPLLSLLPVDGELEAQLFAPARNVGFIRGGQAVRLRYAAFPFQKFGQHAGVVHAVSRTALAPGDLPAAVRAGAGSTAGATPEPMYRIVVALAEPTVRAYGRREALQADMQVEADVLLDRRRVVEWIFEPLIAAFATRG